MCSLVVVAVGGSRRRSRAGPFARAAVVFFSCSSPVRSPVVVLVLVSRLLYGRRSARSEGAGGNGGQARDARGARASPWVVLAAAVEQGRSRAPRWSLLLLLFSRPVRRSARAPLLRSARGLAGARAPRAGARTCAERDATGSACAESERGAPSELAARGFARRVCFCVSGLCCSPLPALRAPLSRSACSARLRRGPAFLYNGNYPCMLLSFFLFPPRDKGARRVSCAPGRENSIMHQAATSIAYS